MLSLRATQLFRPSVSFLSSLPRPSVIHTRTLSTNTPTRMSAPVEASSSASGSTRPIVLCGPSGVGKSTLIKKLFAEFPDQYGFSVSHTTRSPRPGEQAGVHYHYVSRSEFEDLVAKGAFLEHAIFGGNMYGTTVQAVKDVSAEKGKRALLDIDAQGVKLLKANHPTLDPIFIFISPPNLAALHARLKARGTETPESTLRRLSMAKGEMEYARSDSTGQTGRPNFDIVVVNDDLERAYSLFKRAVRESAGPQSEGSPGSQEGLTGDSMPPEEDEGEVLALAQKEVDEAQVRT